MSTGREARIPRRVMMIDEDASVREPAMALLKAAGIDVVGAVDGEEALTLSTRQWFPVLVTKRHIPIIDGIELAQRIRAIAVAPVYIIMVTDGGDSEEYERGYCAGVDHYLTRQNLDTELVSRVATGLFAIRRRQTTDPVRGEGSVIVDLENGAHTARHLIGRLQAEIALAARRGKPLTVVSACIQSGSHEKLASGNADAASAALLAAVQGSIRPGMHWIARLPATSNSYRLAIVMPESDAAEVSTVEQGIRNAFVPSQGSGTIAATQLSIGSAALAPERKTPTALELLGEAERRRRGPGGRTESAIRDIQGETAQAETVERAAPEPDIAAGDPRTAALRPALQDD